MKKIIKYVMLDILRSKVVIGYTLFLLTVSLSVFSLEDSADKGLLSLLNIVLFIVPLVAIIFQRSTFTTVRSLLSYLLASR